MNKRNPNDEHELQLKQLDADHLLQDALASDPIDGPNVHVDKLISLSKRPKKAAPIARVNEFWSKLIPAGIATIVLLAIGLIAFWPGRIDRKQASPATELIERIREVESLSYLITETTDDDDTTSVYRQVYILGKHLKREEVGEKKTIKRRLIDATLQLAGQELPPDFHYFISNAKTGMNVSVRPSTKSFVVLTKQITYNLNTGEEKESDIKPYPEVDFYSQFQEIPADATDDLGEKMIDGRRAIGFGVKKKQRLQERSEEYWVDAETKLPLRIVIALTEAQHPAGFTLSAQKWVMSDFEFDCQLDESLFSTEPPDGYSVEDSSVMGIDVYGDEGGIFDDDEE